MAGVHQKSGENNLSGRDSGLQEIQCHKLTGSGKNQGGKEESRDRRDLTGLRQQAKRDRSGKIPNQNRQAETNPLPYLLFPPGFFFSHACAQPYCAQAPPISWSPVYAHYFFSLIRRTHSTLLEPSNFSSRTYRCTICQKFFNVFLFHCSDSGTGLILPAVIV